MALWLFRFYGSLGDLVTVNERMTVISEIRADSSSYKADDHEYTAFHSGIRDIKIRDERITNIFLEIDSVHLDAERLGSHLPCPVKWPLKVEASVKRKNMAPAATGTKRPY